MISAKHLFRTPLPLTNIPPPPAFLKQTLLYLLFHLCELVCFIQVQTLNPLFATLSRCFTQSEPPAGWMTRFNWYQPLHPPAHSHFRYLAPSSDLDPEPILSWFLKQFEYLTNEKVWGHWRCLSYSFLCPLSFLCVHTCGLFFFQTGPFSLQKEFLEPIMTFLQCLKVAVSRVPFCGFFRVRKQFSLTKSVCNYLLKFNTEMCPNISVCPVRFAVGDSSGPHAVTVGPHCGRSIYTCLW